MIHSFIHCHTEHFSFTLWANEDKLRRKNKCGPLKAVQCNVGFSAVGVEVSLGCPCVSLVTTKHVEQHQLSLQPISKFVFLLSANIKKKQLMKHCQSSGAVIKMSVNTFSIMMPYTRGDKHTACGPKPAHLVFQSGPRC